MTIAKATLVSPNERIDKEDFDNLTAFAKGNLSLHTKMSWLDLQSRILKNFRVELPDQSIYPGRIVVHAGAGFDTDGELLFNQSQLDISRTITLEGAGTTFYVEIKFIESDAVLDSRGFWDPTVDQGSDPSGDPRPDGQEFSAGVATRKMMDWKIVQPVRTDNFTRNIDPTSLYLPLIKVVTNNANKITVPVNPSLATENVATVILEVLSTTRIRVQDSTNLPDNGGTMTVGYGAGSSESVTVSLNDRTTNILTISTLSNTHYPGEIVRAAAGSTDFITESQYGRYAKSHETSPVDYRDKLFQGDEEHGHILSRAMTGNVDQRSDVSVQALKDYVDFLSAQIQELKWGSTSPFTDKADSSRIPPGLSSSFATDPRYYHKSSGVNGARTASITVGDGVNSWGDFVGNTEAVLQAAHDALPSSGGRIFLKRGQYTLYANLEWTNTGSVVLEGEEGSEILIDGGLIHVDTTGGVCLRNLTITGVSSEIGILVDSSDPSGFVMEGILMNDVAFNLDAALPASSSFRRVYFWGWSALMASTPLFSITGSSGTISGTFSECDFNHISMSSLSCSLIDAINGSPTTSLSSANFVDCSFSSALFNAESVNLGATFNIVHFDRCFFWSWLTLCHVRATGGSNIKFTNCVGQDALAGFLYASNLDHVEVCGYLNNNSVGFSAVDLTDCSNVKIKDCDVKINSGVSLSGSAFRITCTSSSLRNVAIESCTIKGDIIVLFNKPTGIIFDINGGVIISGIKLVNNTFDSLETGVYFANSGLAGSYTSVTIEGNNFYDYGVDASTAANQKLGILFGSVSDKSNVSIHGNVFENINPEETNLVSGNSRAAVCIRGTVNADFSICNNVIKRVGSYGFAVSDTAGIFIDTAESVTIEGNTISKVRGAGAFGIRINGTLSNSLVNSNDLTNIFTTGSGTGVQGEAFGIYSDNLSGVTISNNQFSFTATEVALETAASIGCNNNAASWNNVTISGNNMSGNDVGTAFVMLSSTLIFKRSNITGNTLVGDSRVFFECNGAAGGDIDGIAIVGNSAQGMKTFGIRVDAQSSTAAINMSISGNTLNTVTGDTIDILGMRNVSITGNSLFSDASGVCNIYMLNVLKTIISSNMCHVADAAGSRNIKLSTNCRYYQINDNICDLGGGSTGATIDTSASACAASGEGHVYDNLIDDSTNLNGNDDFTSGNGPAY